MCRISPVDRRGGSRIPALALLTFSLSLCGAANLHVSPRGNDANSGELSAPFATIQRAQSEVRERIAAGLSENLAVYIHDGVYFLDAPLQFGPADSGIEEFSVTYAAAEGASPIISGGRVITGWVRGESNRWTTRVPQAASGNGHFRQLFVDGQRLPRGRFPNAPELLHVQSVSEDVRTITVDRSIEFGDLADQNAELVMYQNWSISRVGIESTNGATIRVENPMGWIGHGPATTASPGKPAYIEHALAFVDQPGDWYLDYESGELRYQAAEGEDPNTREFIAPLLDQLVIVGGTAQSPVRNLHFRGLTFAYTHWERPAFGYLGIQAGHHGTRTDEPTYVLPSAIEFTYTRNSSLEHCTVTHTGACGVVFGAGCRDNRVDGCEFSDIGGNGIMVGWRGKGEVTGRELGGDFHLSGDWLNPDDAPINNAITGNRVQQCGAINHGCVGIYDAFARNTRIAHNVVHDMPYTGISVGFRWNETETSQRGAIIEYNHVYDTMKMLADGGCLYTLGYQPGAIIRGNVFHEVHRSAFAHGGAPNNGIFFDEGTKGFHVVGNTIYDTSGDPIRFNQTSETNMIWENNRFGVGASNNFAETGDR